jgi:peptide/nickel transport system permease protein
MQKLPVTLQLATMAMIIALLHRHPGRHRLGGEEGHGLGLRGQRVALWGISTPNFWLGIMLIFLFSVQLGWLPASGYVSPFEDRRNGEATIMPAFVLGNSIAGC